MDYYTGGFRLLVAVKCYLDDYPLPVTALLDTGAEWCVIPPSIAQRLGYDLAPDPQLRPLHSRFGLHRGRLERIGITFPAVDGEHLRVDSTCFVCEDWPGEVVIIGWKGCLERMRFGLDAATETFYFGESQ